MTWNRSSYGTYGFVNLERREYLKTREYNADDYVSLIGTHCDHITLKEPYKTDFYEGIRKVILDYGNKITLYDKITMYLSKINRQKSDSRGAHV